MSSCRERGGRWSRTKSNHSLKFQQISTRTNCFKLSSSKYLCLFLPGYVCVHYDTVRRQEKSSKNNKMFPRPLPTPEISVMINTIMDITRRRRTMPSCHQLRWIFNFKIQQNSYIPSNHHFGCHMRKPGSSD